MAISNHLKSEMSFLNRIDPNRSSIFFQNQSLQSEKRRSRLANFFHWAIHILSGGLIRRNSKLDRVSQAILSEMGEVKGPLLQEEKTLLQKGIKNLIDIIKNNGGDYQKKAEAFLKTVENIELLSSLLKNNTVGQDEEIEEIKEEGPKDSRLSEKLLALQKESAMYIAEALQPLLLEIKNPIALSEEESKILEKAFPLLECECKAPDYRYRDTGWLSKNLPHFSPGVISLLVTHAIAWKNAGHFYSSMLISLTKEPVNQKSMKAFLQSFSKLEASKCGNSASLLKEIDRSVIDILKQKASPKDFENFFKKLLTFEKEEAHSWLKREGKNLTLPLISWIASEAVIWTKNPSELYSSLIASLTEEPIDREKLGGFIRSFPSTLTDDGVNLSLFIYDTFEKKGIDLLKSNTSPEDFFAFAKNFLIFTLHQEKSKDNAVYLLECNRFGKELRKALFQELVNVSDRKHLLSLLDISQKEDILIQDLIDKRRDELEEILKTLPLGIDFLEERFKKIGPYLFEKGDFELKKLCADLLPPEIIAVFIEIIPKELLRTFPIDKWLKIADSLLAIQRNPKATEAQIKALAKGLNEAFLTVELLKDKVLIFEKLISHFDKDQQVKVIDLALDNPMSYSLRDELKKLSPEIFEEASRKNPQRKYSLYIYDFNPEIVSFVVNGQGSNSSFLNDFLWHYFTLETKEKQKICATYLKPEIFSFENPEKLGAEFYKKFFQVLEEIPKERGKKLLIAATQHLFNAPHFSWIYRNLLFTLSRKQMASLPIGDYTKPEIRLLLALLSNHLSVEMIETANELVETRRFDSFFDFFLGISYENASEDELFDLQELFLWILHPETQERLKPVWDWLNVNMNEMLQFQWVKPGHQGIINGIRKAIQDAGFRVLSKEEAKKEKAKNRKAQEQH